MESTVAHPNVAAAPAAKPAKAQVLYDDKCAMCTFQTRWLSWADWFGALDFVPLSDPRVPAIVPNVPHEDLMAAMHVLTPRGNLYHAARAVRYICGRTPLLWPTWLFLWIPGAIQISEHVYRLVAGNRYLISKLFGCKTACVIVPKKQ